MDTSIYKAYDIRGVYPDQINADIVYKTAQAYQNLVQPKTVVLGKDVRESGPELWEAAAQGLTDAGVNVIDIGTVSTDMMYFAVAHLKADGGITISASHNPREYNGMKLVREGAIPISGDTGIYEIRDTVVAGYHHTADVKGTISKQDIVEAYIAHCLSFIDPKNIQQCSIVANANFGMAGVVVSKLIEQGNLPIEITPLNFEPDGSFPKGRPDPFVPENREEMEALIQKTQPDFGVAWDADADRVFFFTGDGDFIDGYFILALLASMLLRKEPSGVPVVIDARMVFASRDAITQAGGIPLVNRIGHSLIKERMRETKAVFAGENSGHYYFRDNYYCDNGIIPFLLILEELSKTKQSLADLVKQWTDQIVVSGEHNYRVTNTAKVIKELEKTFTDGKPDHTDGLSVEYADARFNVRASNTEPLLRLNVEAFSRERLQDLFAKVEQVIKQYEA